MNTTSAEGPSSRVTRRELVLIAGLTALAAVLRLWHLDALPPGLHVDEAFNILDARAVIDGARPAFLPANAGRDVLYTYLQAPLLAVLGESAGTARLASALLGTLTVPVVWAFVRALPLPRRDRVALIAAAFLALSYWHLHFSRFGIRAVAFPLVVTLALWAWWRAAGRGRTATGNAARTGDEAASVVPAAPGGLAAPVGPVASAEPVGPPASVGPVSSAEPVGPAPIARAWTADVVALGILLGLAAYTHPVGRVLWLVPLAHATYRWLRWRETVPFRALARSLPLALIVALPLLVFWGRHPGTFGGHAGEVSILARGPAAVVANTAKVAGMFNVAGDPAPWRNLTARPVLASIAGDDLPDALSGRPVFGPLTGLLFLAGLALALRAAWRGADWAALSLIWLGVLLLPSVLTDAAPNYSRAIGALPVVCLLPALALDRLAAAVDVRWGRRLGPALIVAWLALFGLTTVNDYFRVWAEHEDTPYAFDADKVALGERVLRRTADGAYVYVSPTMAAHPTVRVTAGEPLHGFDASLGVVEPGSIDVPAEYIFRSYESDAINALAGPLSSRAVRDDIEDPFPLTLFTIASNKDIAWYVEEHQMTARNSLGRYDFAPHFRLLDVSFDSWILAGDTQMVTLTWEALEPSDADLTTAVQLVAEDGTTVGQADGQPIGGTYPTSLWREGELILSRHPITVAENAPEGRATLYVGWYLPPDGDRPLEPLPNLAGESVVAVDSVNIGR